MLNHITLLARIGTDITLRHTQTGTPVATFRIACDRDYKDKNTGERATDWLDCVVWGAGGEFVSRNFSKGRMILISGRLQIRVWTDKDGNKRTTAEIVAENVYFGDSRRDGDGQAERHSLQSYGIPPATDEFSELCDEETGDLPF